MRFIFLFIFIPILNVGAQQTIDKLNSNQLRLPKESVSRALLLNSAGQIKSSSTVSDVELGYLDGLSDTLPNLLNLKANDTDVVKLTTNQSISGVKTFTGKLVASTTINASIPCPVMTQTQRGAFTAVTGDCVFNSTTLRLNVYDGSAWKDTGGAGGVSLWLTATPYVVNDVVIQSDKIYRCLIAHTSGTFATDLAALRWVEVSSSPSIPISLANGGTNKTLSVANGGVVWVDADSFEILSPGTSGQILQTNGAASPSWVNKAISAKSDNGSLVTIEEVQVANNQITQTATNKHRIEIGNTNILTNPSFEHSTFSNGWTNSAGTFTEETVLEIDGLKAAKLVLAAQTMSLTQSSTLYQSQFSDGIQGLVSVRIKSNIALKLCVIQAGVVSTTLCNDVLSNNKWAVYRVPFILGATSNGISIASSGAVSGTVYIDDAFLGAINQFNGLDSCADSFECTDVFSAKISASGVVTDENVDWISGNATLGALGYSSITFRSGVNTVPMNCVPVGLESTFPISTQVISQGSTGLTVYTFRNDTSHASVYSSYNIQCQKQGADFVGRTAKAVASDQNIKSIGSLGVDVQSVFFGSGTNCATACTAGNCTICTQVGTKITSVSFVSTGSYDINGVDGTKYICSGSAFNGTANTAVYSDKGASTAAKARILSGLNISNSSIICIGVP
ncbi:MAG: hypothetical protein HUM72_12665 [Dolichospermum sp.]|nr:hypothetical protein [Dolichospermum sp.]